MNVLDLFSGIGGFSLGLERAGMRTVAFCEIEPFQRAVLKKHWPQVPCYTDVRELTAARLRADGISVDVICGGFPCQDISTAGKGAGIEGERSGLWKEYARVISEVRPRYVIVENVSALLGRGLDRVLGDLAEIRYDAEWHCIPASAVGAPHRRDRIWIMAYPNDQREASERLGQEDRRQATDRPKRSSSDMAHTMRQHFDGRGTWSQQNGRDESTNKGEVVQHATYYAAISDGIRRGDAVGQWWVEPDMGRVAHGVPDRTHKLKALGNAVVPQIPEIIGRAIMNTRIAAQVDRLDLD